MLPTVVRSYNDERSRAIVLGCEVRRHRSLIGFDAWPVAEIVPARGPLRVGKRPRREH